VLPLAWLLTTGCATAPREAAGRPFDFSRDTLAFTNQLAWEYDFDAGGRWQGKPRKPKPDYTLRCFPMARAVKQFHLHARFDPTQPALYEPDCARLARRVLDRSPRTVSPPERRVVIPGYAGLREFSAAHATMLQRECGGAAESFFQRGHWRIVFPFSRRQQKTMAESVAEGLRHGQVVSLHLLRFLEKGAFSHAVVAFAVRESAAAYEFDVYDPNAPAAPVTLRFDRAARTFELPRSAYFEGGSLHAYEVYHRCWY
jgi:hypothetical protein